MAMESILNGRGWGYVIELLKKHHVEAVAVPLNSFVQGRVNASLKWQEHVEPVIFNNLTFLPNRANPSVYCGILNNAHVVLCRATDDLSYLRSSWSCFMSFEQVE
jgi:hypothetical protein